MRCRLWNRGTHDKVVRLGKSANTVVDQAELLQGVTCKNGFEVKFSIELLQIQLDYMADRLVQKTLL